MADKKATRRGCHHDRAKVHDTRTDEIVSNGWTRAQCRAIELGLGGGFALMAALEAVMGI